MKYTLALPFLLLSGAAFAQDADPFQVVGMVVDQVCLNDDIVLVGLTARDNAPDERILFRWDRENDRTADSAPSPDPRIMFRYPDETDMTARVGARTDTGEMDTDAVQFTTITCP